MDVIDAVSSIDVAVHSDPGEWWQVALALTPLAALLALVFGLITLCILTAAPRTGSGRRAESWSKAEWAMDLALDDKPERRKAGLALLEQLSTERFVGKDDARLVAHVRALVLDNPR